MDDSEAATENADPAALPLLPSGRGPWLRRVRFFETAFELSTQWLREWRELSTLKRVLPGLGIGLYWLSLQALGDFRRDHLLIGALLLVLFYAGSGAKGIRAFAFPFLLTAIIYDSQRFYSDYLRTTVQVEFPYWFDRTFFGISSGVGTLTPNEWWQQHLHPLLDLITGFTYLIFVFQYVLVSAYFGLWAPWQESLRRRSHEALTDLREKAAQMPWAFLWLNLLGYSTYYWFPAAPPWYVELFGLGPARLDTPANPAGCLRFDQLLGTTLFSEMYGRSADVFGAIPSLHVAYPLLATYYAFRLKRLRIFCSTFFLLMCFSAVYLNHHYILDLLWGSAYALIIGVTVDRLWVHRNKLVTLLPFQNPP